jgi:hypothetical protein
VKAVLCPGKVSNAVGVVQYVNILQKRKFYRAAKWAWLHCRGGTAPTLLRPLELCVNGMIYSLTRVNSGVVNFIQACPHALSELPRPSGKLSAAGYCECVGPAASDHKLSLSVCIAVYCSLISLMDMGCRYVQIGVVYVSLLGDAAASAV